MDPSARQPPVIDVGRMEEDPAVLAAIDAACREWGFFQVVGHGIPETLLADVQRAMHDLFALPPDAKRAIERTPTNAWGFYDRELTKNVRDWKEIFDVGPELADGVLAGNVPQWPPSLPRLRSTALAFSDACVRLAYRLLGAIAANLGVVEDHLAAAFGPRHTSFLRLNHYPWCADPAGHDSPTMPAAGHLGVHHHTDSGALTLLLQDDQPGLQVQHDGRWHLVTPRREALVVNIGDVVQVWSNDRYPAALHRVLASRHAERYSAAFFFNPRADAVYAPLPGTCGPGRPPRYRPIEWGAFRAARAAGDYADRGEEVQISQFSA